MFKNRFSLFPLQSTLTFFQLAYLVFQCIEVFTGESMNLPCSNLHYNECIRNIIIFFFFFFSFLFSRFITYIKSTVQEVLSHGFAIDILSPSWCGVMMYHFQTWCSNKRNTDFKHRSHHTIKFDMKLDSVTNSVMACSGQ
jgi:hypothetical protein